MANAPRSRRFSSRLEKSRNKSGAVELLNLPSVGRFLGLCESFKTIWKVKRLDTIVSKEKEEEEEEKEEEEEEEKEEEEGTAGSI